MPRKKAGLRQKEEAAELEAQKQEAARQEELAQQRKIAEQSARGALQSREWPVYLSLESGKGKTETDILIFTAEGQVSAKNLLLKVTASLISGSPRRMTARQYGRQCRWIRIKTWFS